VVPYAAVLPFLKNVAWWNNCLSAVLVSVKLPGAYVRLAGFPELGVGRPVVPYAAVLPFLKNVAWWNNCLSAVLVSVKLPGAYVRLAGFPELAVGRPVVPYGAVLPFAKNVEWWNSCLPAVLVSVKLSEAHVRLAGFVKSAVGRLAVLYVAERTEQRRAGAHKIYFAVMELQGLDGEVRFAGDTLQSEPALAARFLLPLSSRSSGLI
jgi:hypothetical protein